MFLEVGFVLLSDSLIGSGGTVSRHLMQPPHRPGREIPNLVPFRNQIMMLGWLGVEPGSRSKTFYRPSVLATPRGPARWLGLNGLLVYWIPVRFVCRVHKTTESEPALVQSEIGAAAPWRGMRLADMRPCGYLLDLFPTSSLGASTGRIVFPSIQGKFEGASPAWEVRGVLKWDVS
jgi:hypothetical protein